MASSKITYLSSTNFKGRLAGSNTTAITLRAIIYHLVQNRSTYKQLQKKVDEADRASRLSSYITYTECLELPYL